MITEFKRNGYSLLLDEPEMYVNNEARNRSGHMTHAMAEFAPNCIIDFNANSSAAYCGGHSTYGWVEYRISRDGGKTFSPIRNFPYSVESFLDGIHVISVEKAVACDNGRIVAICLRNNAHALCQPWATPTIVTSDDGGETWSEARAMCTYEGRVYDAVYRDGSIYALEFCNPGDGYFCGHKPEHLYRIFKSDDNGESFYEHCIVPLPTHGRGYGALLFDPEGRLHAYAYHDAAERELDHTVSEDGGVTWAEPDTIYLAHGIRNPQVGLVDGIYIIHGRAENESGFVIYSSKDGKTFDEGEFIGHWHDVCYYSNNITLTSDGDTRMLIQYSETYRPNRVNVYHRVLRIGR